MDHYPVPVTPAESPSGLIPPHGGVLVDRRASPDLNAGLRERTQGLRRRVLTPREASDVSLIAVGAYSPLEGFMERQDYRGVVESLRLANGLVWSLPITLSLAEEEARGLREGEELLLVEERGSLQALLHVQDIFPYDKEREARMVYGTADPAHPGVATLLRQGDLLVGGPIALLQEPASPFPSYHLEPAAARRAFQERGWRSVVGFQTRNPVHRAHEYIQKCALEVVDGLLLHPLVGETKEDDIPADVRIRSYEVLLEHHFPRDRVLLAVLPAAMRYAGPREALFHALVRKNYGCTHFIVGRDHAGVGSYYGPYDAQELLRHIPPGELGIVPLFFENAFYCRLCEGMATEKSCPHGEGAHVALSGTQLRAMLARGETPPPEFTRPEVAQVLLAAARQAAAAPAKG